ncbi:hypothetical protein CRG86_007505 [Photobacterium leiognathi]|uniref:hypothetical protein n=1 Tax=Photobacterium leiognathi TaxID=553611 RepID=UPI000C036FA9|nr:hypothetical protein [Photobacterium leiognathi]PHZ59831.1 hypothetical protein CRG86_007505 [Photobacterium leiognathi]
MKRLVIALALFSQTISAETAEQFYKHGWHYNLLNMTKPAIESDGTFIVNQNYDEPTQTVTSFFIHKGEAAKKLQDPLTHTLYIKKLSHDQCNYVYKMNNIVEKEGLNLEHVKVLTVHLFLNNEFKQTHSHRFTDCINYKKGILKELAPLT